MGTYNFLSSSNPFTLEVGTDDLSKNYKKYIYQIKTL